MKKKSSKLSIVIGCIVSLIAVTFAFLAGISLGVEAASEMNDMLEEESSAEENSDYV